MDIVFYSWQTVISFYQKQLCDNATIKVIVQSQYENPSHFCYPSNMMKKINIITVKHV